MYRFGLNNRDFLYVFLSTIFFFCAFPTLELTGFIWIAFIPLFIAIRDKTPKQSFILGFLMGYGVSLTLFYWVIYTLHEFGHLPWIISVILFLFFCTFCNIHLAIFAYLLRRFPVFSFTTPSSPLSFPKQLPAVLWIPTLFTLLEYIYPQIFNAYIGGCLYKKLWLIQIVDTTGIFGMTFLIMLINVFIYELYLWIKKETDLFPNFSFTLAICLLLFCGIYSYFQLDSYEELMKSSPKIRAGLIQTNIGNFEKFKASQGSADAIEYTKSVNEKLVLEAAKTRGLDLIVLPETAVPVYFTPFNPSGQAEMFDLAARTNTPIAFGAYNKTQDMPPKVFNSLFLISSHFQLLGSYDKTNLLIFGEQLPLSHLFPQLLKWFPEVGNFSRGSGPKVISLSKELKFAPIICLEGLYPSYVRKFIRNGAQFIVTVTNDSWFGPTSNPYQHRALHVWRSIENRSPMLRVANTGISSFIDLTGRILSETPIFQEKILIDEVAIIGQKSFYTQYGDVFIWVLALLWLAMIFIHFQGHIKLFRR